MVSFGVSCLGGYLPRRRHQLARAACEFTRDSLLRRGLISGEDFSLFSITTDPVEAVQFIDDFYRNYHSLRFVGDKLVIRLNTSLDSIQLQTLNEEFNEIIRPNGSMQLTGPLAEEKDQPDLIHLPRLMLDFNRRSYGLLKAFIRRINSF